MPNQHINKVVLGTETLIDLTADTVTPSSLIQGYTAHDASGAAIVGTATGGGTIAVDSESQVGSVEAGTAVTAEPNYTPSGDIRLTTQSATIIDTVALDASYSNYVLTISGISTTSHTINLPTGAAFDGSPVRLVIESEES